MPIADAGSPLQSCLGQSCHFSGVWLFPLPPSSVWEAGPSCGGIGFLSPFPEAGQTLGQALIVFLTYLPLGPLVLVLCTLKGSQAFP